MIDKSYVLANGQRIPAIGFGVGTIKRYAASPKYIVYMWLREKYKNVVEPEFKENNQYKVKKDLKKRKMIGRTLSAASECGIRLFDTARAYQDSEMMLKKYITDGRNTGVPREEYYIITKLTNTAQRERKIEEEFRQSLRELGIEYVDCYLMHWPQSETFLEAWKEVEKIYKSGGGKSNWCM